MRVGKIEPSGVRSIALDVINGWRYDCTMIAGFADKNTERLFRRDRVKRFTAKLQRAALRKLVMLDAAQSLEDLRVPPGNHLEKLSGDREGQYSIRINDQWRICLVWRGGNASNVEIVDYH